MWKRSPAKPTLVLFCAGLSAALASAPAPAAAAASAGSAASAVSPAPAAQPHQATGVKVGEVSETSAIIWTRITAGPSRNARGIVPSGRSLATMPGSPRVEDLEGACPGAPGRVRVRYGRREDLADAKDTDWADVAAASDFTHQFRLADLAPGTLYRFAVDTTGPGGSPEHGSLRGTFRTAPPAKERANVTFTVITGQAYKDLDNPDGFEIYEAMARLKPSFIVPTGDTVYYDKDIPYATTVPIARYHWHRIYDLPRLVAFHLHVPGYWEKDDHDTLFDDCWPSRVVEQMLPMTFAAGQRIFLEQVPMGEKTYRTYRWGKALQIWLPEGRDFRSSNPAKDGPDKTIWGAEQKRWLKDTLLAGDADWKVLVSPTPIVGPDRDTKADNHANAAFATEGREFRRWAMENMPANFFVACGDRHWQYHSVDPTTRLQEFSCGPASDPHAGGSPGKDPVYHRFHRQKGGFLSVSVDCSGDRSTITFRLHDVHGKVVHEYSPPHRPASN